MILLIGHDLPPLLARTMNPLAERSGHRVAHVRDGYGDGVSDEDWMSRLGRERDAAFLTLDANIRNRHGAVEPRGVDRVDDPPRRPVDHAHEAVERVVVVSPRDERRVRAE